MSNPKIVSQKPVLKTTHFEIKENHIDFGNGVTRDHKDVYKRPGVSIFPVTDDNLIYLCRQYRYLLEKDVLEAIAGYIDDNEDPLTAAKRELEEETGLIAENYTQLAVLDISASVIQSKQYLFLATGLTQKEMKQEETENITIVKTSLSKAVEGVMNGEIHSAMSCAGILMLNKFIQEGKL